MDPMQQPEQPILNIIGEKVALGPHCHDLLPLYLKWVNDFEVTRTLAIGLHPLTWEAEEVWYQRTSQGRVQCSDSSCPGVEWAERR